jgi:hypothetical protein
MADGVEVNIESATLCRLFIPTLWKTALNALQQCQGICGRKSVSDALDAKEGIEPSCEFVVDHQLAP